MEADKALRKVGVHIKDSRTNEKKTSLTLYLRLDPNDLEAPKRWRKLLTRFLGYSKRAKAWQVDASKYFFPRNNDVVFLWRLIITGKVDTALQKLSASALESLREGVQLTSMPIRRGKQASLDPSSGKTKGAHPFGSGSAVVSQAFTK